MAINKRLSHEKLMQSVDSPYTLVIAAAKRARQLNDGSKPLIETTRTNKPVTIAMNEIIAGKVEYVRKRADSIK